jgi:hypothetical protein
MELNSYIQKNKIYTTIILSIINIIIQKLYSIYYLSMISCDCMYPVEPNYSEFTIIQNCCYLTSLNELIRQ